MFVVGKNNKENPEAICLSLRLALIDVGLSPICKSWK